MQSRPAPDRIPALAPLLVALSLAVSGHAATSDAGATLEASMLDWLRPRFAEAYASVGAVDGEGVRAVVHVLPEHTAPKAFVLGEPPPRRDADAMRLVDDLRNGVLESLLPGVDFAAGSQFLVLDETRLRAVGLDPTMTEMAEMAAHEALQVVSYHGFAVLRLEAEVAEGPRLALRLRARGLDLGEDRSVLEDRLRQRVHDFVSGALPWLEVPEQDVEVQLTSLDGPTPAAEPPAWPVPEPEPETLEPLVAGAPRPRLPRPPLAIGTVYFASDEARLRPEGEARLEGMLRGRPLRDTSAVVIGHADDRNTDAYNLALGKRRADAVKRFLSGRGVPPAYIEAQTEGEASPVVPNDSPEHRQLNRRATVQVLD